MATLKHSRQRDCIKEFLMGRYDHPTADMVYAHVREEFPHISLGTVYRNLSKLSADGTIRKFSAREGGDLFDGDVSAHSHLLCGVCGNIVDVFSDYSDVFSRDVAEKTGATVGSYSLILSGVCADCISKQNN